MELVDLLLLPVGGRRGDVVAPVVVSAVGGTVNRVCFSLVCFNGALLGGEDMLFVVWVANGCRRVVQRLLSVLGAVALSKE